MRKTSSEWHDKFQRNSELVNRTWKWFQFAHCPRENVPSFIPSTSYRELVYDHGTVLTQHEWYYMKIWKFRTVRMDKLPAKCLNKSHVWPSTIRSLMTSENTIFEQIKKSSNSFQCTIFISVRMSKNSLELIADLGNAENFKRMTWQTSEKLWIS